MASKDGRTSGQRAEAAERRELVWRYIKAGLDMRSVAERVGCSTTTVHRDFRAKLDELNAESLKSARDWRTLLTARYEEALTTQYAKMMRGDGNAFDRVIAGLGALRKMHKVDIEFHEEEVLTAMGGIDPELCTPEELEVLNAIVSRQNEAKAERKKAAADEG